MNELQVKTINFVPANVEFNYVELSAVLDKKLSEYKGLEFTEKQATECKKTITELNKGKKSLNDYRLATKKELTVSVTEFEAKCKELSAKFDDVIGPLKEQADEFEEHRKYEKRNKILAISVDLIKKEGLNAKYAAQLIIQDKYLNKSTTLVSIQEELTTAAEHLGMSQDKEEADIEIIKGYVELINVKHGCNLIDSTYINLLDFQTVDEIKMRINHDVQGELLKRDALTVIVEPPTIVAAPSALEIKADIVSYSEKYEVEGTESQLDALEEYMSSHGIDWKVLADE